MLTTPVNILWTITFCARQMLAGIVSNIAMPICNSVPIQSQFAGLKPTSFTAVLEAKPDRLWQQEVRQAEDPSKVYLPEEASLWVVRRCREEIRTKDAWVVCGGEDDAERRIKKRRTKEELVEKLREDIEKLEKKSKEDKGKALMNRCERLKKKKGELKEQGDELKKMKGQPVGLKKFLEEVVLPHAKLII